jgi:integrase
VKDNDRSSETKERVVPVPEAAMADLIEATKLSLQSGGFVSLSPGRYLYVRSAWTKCRAGLPWGAHKRHRTWDNRDMLNNALRNAKSALRRAGIELTAPFTLTTFRKSFAQNHADNGTLPKTLAKLLGHANVRTTMQYCNRVTDANERAAAARIDELLAACIHRDSTEGQKEDVA